MLFTSLYYPIFLLVSAILYYRFSIRHRVLFCLAASLFYYACFGLQYIPFLFYAAIFSWCSALWLKQHPKRPYLALFILLLLLPLFFFKYLGFTLHLLRPVFSFLPPAAFSFAAPVGISFFTFQCIAYVADVYQGKIQPEPQLIPYLSFVCFFPQLTSGPISRAGALLPQFKNPSRYSLSNIQEGTALLLWGYFEKLMIADRIAVYTNPVFSGWQRASGQQLLLAVLLYAIQIYTDFSGYSHLAIGSARMFGICLPDNFRQPYLAVSVQDFWRRWHISLSAWFRDYLYIPLGGSRKGLLRKYLNLCLVFLLSGLWHGAALTFIVWGGLNAIYQILESFLPLSTLPKFLRRCITFILIAVSWVFFRMNSCSSALQALIRIPRHFFSGWMEVDFSVPQQAILLISLLILLMVDLLHENGKALLPPTSKIWRRGLIVLCLFGAVLTFGIWGQYTPQAFIYFQF